MRENGEGWMDQEDVYDVMMFGGTNVQLEGTILWRGHVPGRWEVSMGLDHHQKP